LLRGKMESTSMTRPPLRLLIPKPLLILLIAAFLSFWGVREAGAVRPISSTLALVAGQENNGGFKDGDFISALFNRPLGLAASSDGTQLFVADSGNQRIRIIHLDQNNEVTTLAGMDGAGKVDGPLTIAQFWTPTGVLCLPDDRLVVNDFGNELFRLIDMKAGTVSTLAGGPATLSTGPAEQVSMKGVRDMAYMPAINSIFYTQPELGVIKRLDLNSHMVSIVVSNNTQLPNPSALWCQDNKLYVSDKTLPKIFEIDWKGNAPTDPVAMKDTLDKVFSLALNDGMLYSLLGSPGNPAERFVVQAGPWDGIDSKVVTFRNPFGDTIPQDFIFPDSGPSGDPFESYAGFAPDASDGRKFYISKPELGTIVSLRDLFPASTSPNSNGVMAPEYPAKKPKNTFRIIICGDSRSVEVHGYPFKTDYHQQDCVGYPYCTNFPYNVHVCPQLEQELNLQAALDGVPTNFEVFNMYVHGDLCFWPTILAPDIVKKNDVDLVIVLSPRGDYRPYYYYYDHSLTSDGIPQWPINPEYLLKPWQDRIRDGLTRKFYDFCKANGLVEIRGNNIYFQDSIITDEKWNTNKQLHDWVLDFYGKPLDVLNRKLSDMRTSGGKPVRLLALFTYTGRSQGCGGPQFERALWVEAAQKYKFPYLDLYPEMNALNFSFIPLTQDAGHFTPDGANFFATLLAHQLIRDKLIPWNDDAAK
jgi:hypothetical protein